MVHVKCWWRQRKRCICVMAACRSCGDPAPYREGALCLDCAREKLGGHAGPSITVGRPGMHPKPPVDYRDSSPSFDNAVKLLEDGHE